ncbi:hypothetical protein GCM10023094_55000 [Rhodococcus olei]|uniref:Uncharacterized protein n=1 Tax=Rhodococcus olei TaxID=2161675 RepID=A0ABP8PQB3_9NOCA
MMPANEGQSMLNALVHGLTEPPASDAYPAADRWGWFADLYTDPTWGLTAAVPEFPRIAAEQIAAACRAAADESATVEQWQAIKTLAMAGLAVDQQPRSLTSAWSVVADTCTDAIDHLDGVDFGGLEAVLGFAEAIFHRYPYPDPSAAIFINGALNAWGRQLDPSVRSAA